MMYTKVTNSPRHSYRDRHKRRHVSVRTQPFDDLVSVVQERTCTVKLRRRRYQAPLSFYDNNETDEEESIISKWTIVRQRLPDILALSSTYKPTSVRAQLVLLLALMNKQASENAIESYQLKKNEFPNTISHIVPSTVIIDVSGRSRIICLKHIPSEQVIHVDIDNLSFSIPTRQFIFAISRGRTHETAAKFCPPAISEMLIDLSKTKVVDDRRQFKRAQFKMHLGQILFFVLFISIFTMMCALMIGATNAVFKIKIESANKTIPFLSMQSLTSEQKGRSFLMRPRREMDYW